MIEGEFENSVGAKAVGFSHSDFSLVVQTLHHAAGNQLLRPEVVENELAVLTERACDLLHRFDARSHGLATPFIEEFASPGSRVVIPELLEGFLQKISSHRFEIVAEQIAQPEVLFDAEILTATEQQPTRLFEDWVATLAFHPASFLGADLIEGFVHISDDMEAVQDMQGLGAVLADELQVWFPHIRAD